MESSILRRQLHPHECIAFAAKCRRHGFRPDQFQVFIAHAVDHVGAAILIGEELLVIYKLDGRLRRYIMEQFTSWLEALENDLQRGKFSTWDDFDLA